jgi:hypothetical protein
VARDMDVARMEANIAALAGIPTLSDAEMLDSLFAQRIDWIELIKTIRQVRNIGLSDAERIALSHERWRRWCERRINTEQKCRKLALAHMRYEGVDALIVREGGRLRVRA